jgi:flavin reductase (DIM6/NTAB) family NADH-FMN oxidoreductase RutF
MAPFDAPDRWSVAPAEPGPFTPDHFKEVLANLASGVAIVSCWDGDEPRGLLVSSITGVSVDPPRFLCGVRKEAGCHDSLVGAGVCDIAILADHDREEAHRFASSARTGERFDPTRWTLNPTRPPVYRGGLSRATCEIDQVLDATTHSILIVSARHAARTDAAVPLVAYARGFHRIAP